MEFLYGHGVIFAALKALNFLFWSWNFSYDLRLSLNASNLLSRTLQSLLQPWNTTLVFSRSPRVSLTALETLSQAFSLSALEFLYGLGVSLAALGFLSWSWSFSFGLELSLPQPRNTALEFLSLRRGFSRGGVCLASLSIWRRD